MFSVAGDEFENIPVSSPCPDAVWVQFSTILPEILMVLFAAVEPAAFSIPYVEPEPAMHLTETVLLLM